MDGGPGDSGSGGRLVAPLETWTWIEIPGMTCANGSPTGVGVNLTDRSKDVLVFFEGGGACWDATTCWALPFSLYISSGYGKTQFDADFQRDMFQLRREDPENPFRNVSYVFMPYCTGDCARSSA